tara:strand:+ start:648 stop:791 length:144 start_codon:yes stop_codon:yes gene_type:complete
MARLKAKYNKADKKNGLRQGIFTSTDKKSKGKIPKDKPGYKKRKSNA